MASQQTTKYFQNCLGVFQGGGVKAIAFAGAYEEAFNRGVFFSELAGASAGSIIASLIGAGATPDQIYEIMNELNFSSFLKDPVTIAEVRKPKLLATTPKLVTKGLGKISQKIPFITNYCLYLGSYDSSQIRIWINNKLCSLLNRKDPIRFRDLLIPTTIVATNITTRAIQVWSSETTPDEEVGYAVQASCSIPFFFQPVNLKYVDGGLLSNLPSFLFKEESIYDKVLGFGFESGYQNVVTDYESYFSSLLETTIDGSVDIQLRMASKTHLIKIDTGKIKATDFELIGEKEKKELITNGQNAVKTFFDNEIKNIKLDKNAPRISENLFETFNYLIKSKEITVTEVLVSDEKTQWAFSLFPLLFKWVHDNAKIKILLIKNNTEGDDGVYRRVLLKNLGCQIYEVDELPFKGFVINGDSKTGGIATIMNDQLDYDSFHSKTYFGEEDKNVIHLLRKEFITHADNSTEKTAIKLQTEDPRKLIETLRRVQQYSKQEVDITFEPVDLSQLIFLTKYIKGYKYRQVETLFNIYKNLDAEYFVPVNIVSDKGLDSVIAPPVVEKHGDEFIVIEGNARFAYAYRNKLNKVCAVVVHNVSDPLPSEGRFKLNELIITDLKKAGHSRYPNFDPAYYRHIEKTVRNP